MSHFLDAAFPVETRHVEGGPDQICASVAFDRARGHLDIVAFDDDAAGTAQISIYAGSGVNISLTFDIAQIREVAEKSALVLKAYEAARAKAKGGAR